jgi:hypothetical protein
MSTHLPGSSISVMPEEGWMVPGSIQMSHPTVSPALMTHWNERGAVPVVDDGEHTLERCRRTGR